MVLPSGLPEVVADGEPPVRFLTSDSQFNSKMAKPPGFMPGPQDAKTSVFRQATDPVEALWETAEREIPSRTARAAAVLTAADVRIATLDVEADEPPPRHANIAGWPEIANDPAATRAKCKELALLLTRASKLYRR